MSDNTGNTNTGDQNADKGTANVPGNYDEWFEAQEAGVKALLTNRFTALQNTVKATRDERDAFKGQIQDLASKVEKGSEVEQQLSSLAQKLEVTERRASFMEQAMKPEVSCRNPAAAWALATTMDEGFTKKGLPDWQAIKAAAPELFGVRVPNAHGGDGTGDKPGKTNMNDLIRRKAGR